MSFHAVVIELTLNQAKDSRNRIIGGLRQKDESKSVTKPFLLGDLPLIGKLFRRTVKNRRETDLIVLITPRLVDTGPMEELQNDLPSQLFETMPDASKGPIKRRMK